MSKCHSEKCEDKNCDHQSEEKPNIEGDYWNVALLLLLYGLQGVPQGIGTAMPILLQNRGISYTDQAKFSFSFFPYSIKLLWAPVIDSIYIKIFGRRKTWICSSQVLLGICMIFLSFKIDFWLLSDPPYILNLTAIFGVLWFLTSTQDIAVDGWGLTLLQRKNVGYAATCNIVGQTVGKIIGNILLLVFESKEFCNEYIFTQPRETGLFTLSSFLLFWGVVYLCITLLVAVFKHERDDFNYDDHPDYGISKAYPILLKILKLRPVILLCLTIFSVEGAFAVWENITALKLIDYGITKDKIALFSIPSVPVQIFLPLLITSWTAGPKPLSFYYKVFPCRLFSMMFTAVFVYYTPSMISEAHYIPFYVYGLLTVTLILEHGLLRASYAGEASFDVKIVDPLVGGTYITLLNTCSHLGKRTSTSFFLWLLDKITFKTCDPETSECKVTVDGYYIEITISLIYGLIWMKVFKSIIAELQSYPRESWYILTRSERKEEEMQTVKFLS